MLCTAPEVWSKGKFLPDAHTVSISDLYFIAHFCCLLQSVVGNAILFDSHGLTLGQGSRIEASVIIKAVGFEVNGGNERISGRSCVHGGHIVDRGLWTLFEAHPDGNFSSSAFGSYMDSVPFTVRLMLRYWHRQDVYSRQLSRLFAAPDFMPARINHITSSQAGTGMAPWMEGDSQLLVFMREHVNEVAAFSSDMWSPSQFIEHNRHGWDSLHEQVRELNGARFDEQMRYPMEDAMDVVRLIPVRLISLPVHLISLPVRLISLPAWLISLSVRLISLPLRLIRFDARSPACLRRATRLLWRVRFPTRGALFLKRASPHEATVTWRQQ